MEISEHITYREAINSITAIRNGLDNTPNEAQLYNIKIWASKVFEPLRKLSACPISVDSIYRSQQVNTYVGGVWNSQHLCNNGDSAGDLDNDNHPNRLQNNTLFYIAYNNLIVDYDQIIAENIDETDHVGWIHISYNSRRNQRRNALVSFYNDEKIRVYKFFDPVKGFIKSKYI
jgi:hypothetical protein